MDTRNNQTAAAVPASLDSVSKDVIMAYSEEADARTDYIRLRNEFSTAEMRLQNACGARETAIERLNSRLKAFCKLNFVRVRGRLKVRVHAMLSVIVLQARALATGCRALVTTG